MFFVYEHWRTDTNQCFYVGKGRAGRPQNMSSRNRHHKNIQEKLKNNGFSVRVLIVAKGLTNDEALDVEVSLIRYWQRSGVVLANISPGGDGTSGYKHNAATREKMRISALKANTEEVRKKKSQSMKGLVKSESHRAAIAKTLIGQKRAAGKRSKEFCEHMSRVLKGRKLTPEQVEQRRVSMTAYWRLRKEAENPVATASRGT
jgi:hypothetical protein